LEYLETQDNSEFILAVKIANHLAGNKINDSAEGNAENTHENWFCRNFPGREKTVFGRPPERQ
jgi:hypothetical protein